MKRLNDTDYQALELISKEENVTRISLAQRLNITPSAISKIIKKLISFNLVIEDEKLSSSGGRPGKVLKINNEYKKIIGINFGSGFIDITVSLIDGEIIETNRKTFHLKVAERLIRLLINEIGNVVNKYGKNEIAGIGLAINGTVDTKTGSSIYSPHLRWNNLKVKDYLETKFSVPVLVDNDVRCMLRAEMYYDRNSNIENALYLYIKDGIGASLLIKGEIFEGCNFSAGEIGHYVINSNSNIKCKCGKYGCLETEYSTNVLKDKINWELEKIGNISYKDNAMNTNIFLRALKGENPYYKVIKDSSYDIGLIIGNIINILDIGNIIVAGDIINSQEVFFNNFQRGIDEMVTPQFGNYVSIKKTRFGEDVEKYGAISLIIENLFSGDKLIK